MSLSLKLKTLPNEKVCEIIISFRCLGLLKEEAKLAMIELMSRKKSGSDFDYNAYINQKVSEFPKLKPQTSLNLFKKGINDQSRND